MHTNECFQGVQPFRQRAALVLGAGRHVGYNEGSGEAVLVSNDGADCIPESLLVAEEQAMAWPQPYHSASADSMEDDTTVVATSRSAPAVVAIR